MPDVDLDRPRRSDEMADWREELSGEIEMSRWMIAIGLALVGTPVYAQRGEHGPPTSGPSTTAGPSASRAAENLLQHSAAIRSSATIRSGERSPLNSGGSLLSNQGAAASSLHRHSALSNSTRGTERRPATHQPESELTSADDQSQSAEQRRRLKTTLEKITGHERALQVQLATADRMRDRALETGDPKMLVRADEYEQKARARFAELSGSPEPTDPGAVTGDANSPEGLSEHSDSSDDSGDTSEPGDNSGGLSESGESGDDSGEWRESGLTPRDANGRAEGDSTVDSAVPPASGQWRGIPRPHTQDNSNSDEQGHRAFGQAISEAARSDGRAFGQFTAGQARDLGREFGSSNAAKTRVLPPPPPLTLPPSSVVPNLDAH